MITDERRMAANPGGHSGTTRNPARLAQPRPPTLRTSHFPGPPDTTLRRLVQPLDKHRGTQGNRPVRALTRAATRSRRRTQRPATQNSGRHHTRTSHAAPTVGPRITRRCDDRLNSPIPKRHSCRCPRGLRVLRLPTFLRTLLHGVLHPGSACTDTTEGVRNRTDKLLRCSPTNYRECLSAPSRRPPII